MPEIVFNKEKNTLDIKATGQRFASFKPSLNMWIPDPDPEMELEDAIHLFTGMMRVHETRFSKGEIAAKALSADDFGDEPSWKKYHDADNDDSFYYCSSTETIRTTHGHMVMNNSNNIWQMDFDSGASEALLLKAFTTFHINAHERNNISGEEFSDLIENCDEPDFHPLKM